jgi:hypothetical protein
MNAEVGDSTARSFYLTPQDLLSTEVNAKCTQHSQFTQETIDAIKLTRVLGWLTGDAPLAAEPDFWDAAIVADESQTDD